jgi:hypothetical protein
MEPVQQPPAAPTFVDQVKAYWQKYLDWLDQRATAQQERATAQQEREQATAAATGNQIMRQYKGDGAMRSGITSMQKQGWRVSSQSSFQPRSGCMRIILLGGIGALLFKPKPVFLVTYVRG